MNLMRFFGFDNDDDDYDDNDDYTEDRRRKPSTRRENSSGSSNAAGKLILFNGVATDNNVKYKLREALNGGAMILIDLHELNQREFEEEGKDFITFMGALAFARDGELKYIEPAQYLVTPRPDMFEVWPERRNEE